MKRKPGKHSSFYLSSSSNKILGTVENKSQFIDLLIQKYGKKHCKKKSDRLWDIFETHKEKS